MMKDKNKKFFSQRLLWLVLVIFILGGLILSLPYLVSSTLLKRIESYSDCKIGGKIKPAFTLDRIHIDDFLLVWKDDFKIEKGELDLSFKISALLPKKSLDLEMEAKDLSLKLYSEFLKKVGVGELNFKSVSARIILFPNRDFEIKYLKADSDLIKLNITSNE